MAVSGQLAENLIALLVFMVVLAYCRAGPVRCNKTIALYLLAFHQLHLPLPTGRPNRPFSLLTGMKTRIFLQAN